MSEPEHSMLHQEESSSEERSESKGTSVGQVVIDMLPDNALLEVFDLHRDDPINCDLLAFPYMWRWVTLAHVCQRWQNIIFGSPWHLDL